MKQKYDLKKYGIVILILLAFFSGIYIFEGQPSRLNNRGWGYLHPDDASRDVSKWIYKFEVKDFRNGGGHEVYELRTNTHVPLDGHKVYILVFKSTNPDFLGDSKVYFDYYSRRILGTDLVF